MGHVVPLFPYRGAKKEPRIIPAFKQDQEPGMHWEGETAPHDIEGPGWGQSPPDLNQFRKQFGSYHYKCAACGADGLSPDQCVCSAGKMALTRYEP